MPSLATIPFDPSAPERMLAGDIFHIVKSCRGLPHSFDEERVL